MNTKGKIAIEESKTRISTVALIRKPGFSAILTKLGIAVIGMFYPILYAFNIARYQNLLETLKMEN